MVSQSSKIEYLKLNKLEELVGVAIAFETPHTILDKRPIRETKKWMINCKLLKFEAGSRTQKVLFCIKIS